MALELSVRRTPPEWAPSTLRSPAHPVAADPFPQAPKKRVAPIPAAARKGAAKPAPVKKAVVNPLYEKRPKIFGTFRAGPAHWSRALGCRSWL